MAASAERWSEMQRASIHTYRYDLKLPQNLKQVLFFILFLHLHLHPDLILIRKLLNQNYDYSSKEEDPLDKLFKSVKV